MLNNLDDLKREKLNCEKLETSFRCYTDNSSDENSVNIEFDNIPQSFIKKYIRYSDNLKDTNKKENDFNNKEDQFTKRKVHSAEENAFKGMRTKYSPFSLAKTKNSEKILKSKNNLSKEIDSNPLDNFDLNSKNISHKKKKETLYTLPRRKNVKKIFEEFIVIGIENNGLEYIDDIDELLMTPKITYNYPNKLNENELKFNIKFLKNFCFNEGVKVTRNEISSDEEFESVLLERNFFSRPKSYFCLVQQITPEDIQKYFIFGIKFEDFYVVPILLKRNSLKLCDNLEQLISAKRSNSVNIYTYEKTYLFISTEPLCHLFEQILQCILNIKKLNFLNNLTDFSSIYVKNFRDQFTTENNENEGVQINEILNYFHYKKYPLFEEDIKFSSKLNNICLEYHYPNPFNEIFLAIDWLSVHFFEKLNYDTLYSIMTRILLEHSIIFVCENIMELTITVLGFSYLIYPFKWPFILIPNLPIDLMNMIDSPVPYLIGILGDRELKKSLLKNTNGHRNYDLVYIENSRIEFMPVNEKITVDEPYLRNLKSVLKQNFSELSNNSFDNVSGCQRIYKRVYDNLRSEFASKIESIAKTPLIWESEDIFSNSNANPNSNATIGTYRHKSDKIKSKVNLHSSCTSTVNNNNNLSNRFRKSQENTNENSVLSFSQYKLIKTAFEESLNTKDKNFGKSFKHTQLFLNYFEDMRLKLKCI